MNLQSNEPRPTLEYAKPSRPPLRAIRWKTVGWAVLLVIGGLFVLSLLLPTINRPLTGFNRVKCANNLRQIGLGIQMYVTENSDHWPETLQTVLENEDLEASVFVCPATEGIAAEGATKAEQAANLAHLDRCSYFYLGPAAFGRYKPDAPELANVIVAYELPANHGGSINVLFGDIHVEPLAPADARKLLGLVATGVRPVIWLPPAATQPTTNPQK